MQRQHRSSLGAGPGSTAKDTYNKVFKPFIELCVLVAQSCLTFYDPMDCSSPGSSVRGILQARRLEWVAIPFSRGSSWPRGRTHISSIAGRFFIELKPRRWKMSTFFIPEKTTWG